ncbi:MAG: hypothetical protein K9L17_08250 [Clostridiales bacterium]|nr:hypothetical protein [Clostridiales bacterium]MCF8022666.1 hypothetical protein [Clostridiales bacterium]
MVDLKKVLTLQEATKRWKLADGATLRKPISRNRFREGEIRKSKGTWLITYKGMKKVFDPEPKD